MSADVKSSIVKTKESGYGYISEADRKSERQSQLKVKDIKNIKEGLAK